MTEILIPDGPDRGLPWHYGDPFAEQRRMVAGGGALILGNQGVLSISGTDRLIWLNEQVAEPLSGASLNSGARLTLVGENGVVSALMYGIDDGQAFWGVVDGDWPVIGYWLMTAARQSPFNVTATPWPSDQKVAAWVGVTHPLRRRAEVAASFASTVGLGRCVILPPDQAAATVSDEPVGLWAYEALRIAARCPRPPLDTDNQTTPAELSGGVAQSSRWLRLLHLDGSGDDPTPSLGTPLILNGKTVGRLGSSAQHYEQGPIGLALVDTTVPLGTTLLAGETAALIA